MCFYILITCNYISSMTFPYLCFSAAHPGKGVTLDCCVCVLLLALVLHRACAAVCPISVHGTVAAAHGRSPLNTSNHENDIIHLTLIDIHLH